MSKAKLTDAWLSELINERQRIRDVMVQESTSTGNYYRVTFEVERSDRHA